MPYQLLFADDSVTMHRVVDITLGREDFEVTHAQSGSEALQKAQQSKFDVIVIDLGMPSLDGYATCQALRRESLAVHTPVLVLGCSQQPYDDTRGQAVGVSSHMLKPFDTQSFIDRIKSLLGVQAAAHSMAVSAATAAGLVPQAQRPTQPLSPAAFTAHAPLPPVAVEVAPTATPLRPQPTPASPHRSGPNEPAAAAAEVSSPPLVPFAAPLERAATTTRPAVAPISHGATAPSEVRPFFTPAAHPLTAAAVTRAAVEPPVQGSAWQQNTPEPQPMRARLPTAPLPAPGQPPPAVRPTAQGTLAGDKAANDSPWYLHRTPGAVPGAPPPEAANRAPPEPLTPTGASHGFAADAGFLSRSSAPDTGTPAPPRAAGEAHATDAQLLAVAWEIVPDRVDAILHEVLSKVAKEALEQAASTYFAQHEASIQSMIREHVERLARAPKET